MSPMYKKTCIKIIVFIYSYKIFNYFMLIQIASLHTYVCMFSLLRSNFSLDFKNNSFVPIINNRNISFLVIL